MRAVFVSAVIGPLLLCACSPWLGPDEGDAPRENQATIWYVDEHAPPGGDGTSWATAFTHPQPAVNTAKTDEVVKVAQGVYSPWNENEGNAVIAMKTDVELYGGYCVEGGKMRARDPLSHPSILVGSANGEIEPSKHVVLGASRAILDGFEIHSGLATSDESGVEEYGDPAENSDPWGGGMLNESVQRLIIQNCHFHANLAESGGGAITNVDSRVYIRRSQFWFNEVRREDTDPGSEPCYYGGAIAVWGGSLELVNSMFIDNYAGNRVLTDIEGYGGALATGAEGDAIVVNCSFVGGYADHGLMLYDDPSDGGELELRNSILWAHGAAGGTRLIDPGEFDNVSYSDVELLPEQSSYSGPGNINQDPEYYGAMDPEDPYSWSWESLRIPVFHDCCDAVPVDTAPRLDFTGFTRNGADGWVQMGALEEPYIPDDPPETDPSYEAGDRIVHELDDTELALRYASAGSFEMGWGEAEYERPVHTVNLDAFWIGEREVTQLMWEDVWGDEWPRWPPEQDHGMGDAYPAYSVNYFHVVAFCNELSIQLGFEPCYYADAEFTTPYGKSDAAAVPPRPGIEPLYWDTTSNGFRLPTEAEWEYAARYRSSGAFTPGDYLSGASDDYTDSEACGEVAWYDNNSAGSSHPVAGKTANDLGCHDMSGNVLEWVWDAPDSYTAAEQTNPTGPEPTEPTLDQRRILRGGWYLAPASSCRVTNRVSITPNVGTYNFGLRLVRSAGPEE